MNAVIEVIDLHKSFGSKKVLQGVSLTIESGESFVVIGCSGTGKSVLIKCILGLLPLDHGEIKINGRSTKNLSVQELREALLKCGVLYQGAALFDSMNVIDNVAFGLMHGYDFPKRKAYKIAIEKLEAVDLNESIAYLSPSELSGGMKKRVALARALATSPDIIFFDEPTTGLDPITSNTINNLIVKCTKELGISALSITHDLVSLRQISDKVALLNEGKIIWNDSMDQLDKTDNPYIKQFMTGAQTGPFSANRPQKPA